MFTVVSLAAQKFPGEKRMWDFLVTKLRKSQKQSTLAKQRYWVFVTESKCIVKQSPLLTSLSNYSHMTFSYFPHLKFPHTSLKKQQQSAPYKTSYFRKAAQSYKALLLQYSHLCLYMPLFSHCKQNIRWKNPVFDGLNS